MSPISESAGAATALHGKGNIRNKCGFAVQKPAAQYCWAYHLVGARRICKVADQVAFDSSLVRLCISASSTIDLSSQYHKAVQLSCCRASRLPAGLMSPEGDSRNKEVLWRHLLDLLTCAACWPRTDYQPPSDEPTQPPVQTLAESLIPTGVPGLSAHPSVDEEAAVLIHHRRPGVTFACICQLKQKVVKALTLH